MRTVTFDLFSALLDSRTGGSRAWRAVADRRAWPVPGEVLYDEWDRRNKAAQKGCVPWQPWRVPPQRRGDDVPASSWVWR
jgi:2-haloacid dehalogenase